MEIIKALKMRIYPDDSQKAKIDKTIGSCRFIYNHMLDRNIKAYSRRKEHLTYNNMQNLLPIMKDYLPWLKEADSQALKYACRQVDLAFKNFFTKRTSFPNYLSINDIKTLLGVSQSTAKKVFEKADELDDKKFKEFRVETKR